MAQDKLKHILTDVKKGKLTIDEAVNTMRGLSFQDLGYVKIDHHRSVRTGFPEVIYCPNKETDQVVEIFKQLAAEHNKVLATRADNPTFEAVKAAKPEVTYNPLARTIIYNEIDSTQPKGNVLIISAGTSDMPVAEEASETCKIMGDKVTPLYDVGVAGIHRLLSHESKLKEANCIVVVAGMEGALPSVVGGLASVPVIACPTSVGYGASFEGISPLLTMLNSCASGISVVNIDNGFGAGYQASLINKLALSNQEKGEELS